MKLNERNGCIWPKSRNNHYKPFVGRRKIIRRLRNEKLLSKIENKKRKEMQIRKPKELCTKIGNYGGLWKSCEEIRCNLARLNDGKEIIEALKCQSKFRQKFLLESNIVDTNLFHFTCKKDIFSNSKLRENLENIICCIDEIKMDFEKCSDNNMPVLSIPVEKMYREKERLQLLLASENKKNGDIQEPK